MHGTALNTKQWDSISNWRLSILVLCWASFGLFTITFTVFVLKLLSSLCSCLGEPPCGAALTTARSNPNSSFPLAHALRSPLPRRLLLPRQ